MPQEPLNLIQIYSGLNHPGRECMAKIVEMKILNLRMVERHGQSPPDVAPIKWRLAFAVEDEINLHWACRVLTFQKVQHGRVHRDRPSLAVF